jgi:hypothetical protein
MKVLTRVAVVIMLFSVSAAADGFDQLARDFWAWRAQEMPFSADDIPRLERPAGWKGDWSPRAVAKYRRDLLSFERRWRGINVSKEPISRQVDYRLMGSAIARVRWELEITRNWQRNPFFYIDQTMGAIFLAVLPPPPFTEERSAEIVRRFAGFPEYVAAAKQNLTDPRAPFAKLAIAELREVRPRLREVAKELKPLLASSAAERLDAVVEKGIASLEDYRAWLEKRFPTMTQKANVGREAYIFFLKNVALIPHSPEELVAMGRQEWERSVSFEVYEANRNAGLPKLELFPDQVAQMAREEKDENDIRAFLEANNIVTVPDWVQHYRNLPMPSYVKPLANLGVTDDLTSPTRLEENGISYINPPSPQMGYFGASTARDPRPIIVHEGVPGHYFQKVLSWTHENPLRRHYYDSAANEGIGFYAEEMMLQAGLWDNSPRSREIIYNFMRLRALRVEVDVKIALGTFSIEQAADYFVKMVPMDHDTALDESLLYASTPGVAISYQTGKLQILRFLAEAKRAEGDKFNLRRFHDFVWKNGNVPIALQKWEYLGKNDELLKLQPEPAKRADQHLSGQ